MFRNAETRREMTARNRMGVRGVTVYDPCDEESQSMYDRKILGFEDESPKAKALADIATRILEMSLQISLKVSIRSLHFRYLFSSL